jgi:ribosomal protein S18 acetylase RimI-like enzyme
MNRKGHLAIVIRPARTTDLESLTALLLELFQIETDFTPDAGRQEAGLKQLLTAAGAVVLVAESHAEIVGMCTVQRLISTVEGGPAGLLEDMIVKREFRRQGIGQALLSAAEDWAAGQGLTRLQLLAEAENQAALDFYAGSGWQTTGLVCRRKMLKG